MHSCGLRTSLSTRHTQDRLILNRNSTAPFNPFFFAEGRSVLGVVGGKWPHLFSF